MSRHASLESLLDYRFGDMSDADAETLEEHLFECEACGRHARSLVVMDALLHDRLRAGVIPTVAVTPSVVRRLNDEKIPYTDYVISDGETVECQATRDQHFSLVHMKADFLDVERVDLESVFGSNPAMVVENVAIDRERGEVVLATSGELIRSLPALSVRFTLHAVSGDERRPLGTYRLNHTPLPD